MTIKDLKPASVFAIFDEINKVPRPSKKEEKIRKYLLDFAAAHNIEVKTDAVGNVAMFKPATPGKEAAPCVIMQAHMDMVCESNDKNFDFDNNPITTVVDGDWLRAEGTTLGADNGIGVAAALVLSIGAGATGVFKSASDAFAGVFGPTADTEIIDQIGRPIGASDTSNGVTVTADAILFDGYNYLISYTLEKEDGSAFDCTKNPDTGLLNVYWNRADSNIGLNAQGAIGSSYFYDENPNDNAIQYVETMSYTDAVTTGGTAKIMLGDLTAVTDNGAETKTIADGTWHLKFKLEADNSAVELPAGQSIQVGGKTATINKVLLSPIGYNFVYTVDGKAPFENAESGQEPASHRDTWDAFSAKLLINKKDGTVIDMPGNGGSMDVHDGKTVCTRQGTFDTILPLDEVASVTIGDTTIPVK